MPIQSIEHPNVSEMAFEQIKELISTGEWKPGDKIPPEIELAKMMGVSRVSIRAAMQKLVGLGIIERRQGKGTIVCNLAGEHQINGLVSMLVLDPPDLQAMNEFRMIIECGAAELAAKRCNDDTIVKLQKNLEMMKEKSRLGEDTAEIDVDFHMLIAQATDNPMVQRTYEVMRDSFLSCMTEYKKIIDIRMGVYFHTILIDALKCHDAAAAKRIMREHLQKNQTDIEKIVSATKKG